MNEQLYHENPNTSNAVEEPDEMLWVDRYRPHKFTDLVGNEKVARDAMAWVKEWISVFLGTQKARNEAEMTRRRLIRTHSVDQKKR